MKRFLLSKLIGVESEPDEVKQMSKETASLERNLVALKHSCNIVADCRQKLIAAELDQARCLQQVGKDRQDFFGAMSRQSAELKRQLCAANTELDEAQKRTLKAPLTTSLLPALEEYRVAKDAYINVADRLKEARKGLPDNLMGVAPFMVQRVMTLQGEANEAMRRCQTLYEQCMLRAGEGGPKMVQESIEAEHMMHLQATSALEHFLSALAGVDPMEFNRRRDKAAAQAEAASVAINMSSLDISEGGGGAAVASSPANRGGGDETLCCVCIERDIESIVIPCGHLCLCVQCSAGINECPICRQPGRVYRVFFAADRKA